MRLGGVPNDILVNLNPLSLLIIIPLLDTLFYPFLRKMRIKFTPLKRITAGYFVASCSMIWACVLQYYIYKKSECGSNASGYLDDDQQTRCPNVDISVWAQTGSYVLIALSEAFASITSLEYAHSKAPKSARSMVQAVCLFMNAISSAIGFALVPLAEDPNLIWNYGVVAVMAAVGGTAFWLQFRDLDAEEDRLNMLPSSSSGGGAAAPEGAAVLAVEEAREKQDSLA